MAGPYFWVLGDGAWDNTDTTNISASSGGAGGAGPPLVTDDLTFDAASSAIGYTVTMGTGGACLDLNMAAPASGTITWAGSANMAINGNVSLLSGMTNSYTGTITWGGGTSNTWASNTVALGSAVTAGAGTSWQFTDAFTTTGTVTYRAVGTLDLNGQTATCNIFDSSSSNARTITSGGGKIVVAGNGATVLAGANLTNLTLSDNLSVELSYLGATGTRTINWGGTGGGTEARAPDVTILGGTDSVAFSAHINDLDFGAFAGTWSGSGAINCYGSFTLSAGLNRTASSALNFLSTSAGNVITTAGIVLNNVVTFNGVGGGWTFADDFISGSGTSLNLTNGSITLGANDIEFGIFTTSNANARTIVFSAGSKLSLVSTSTSTIVGASTATNLTVTRLGGTIEIGGNTTTVRPLELGAGISWPAITFTNTTANGGIDIRSSGAATVIKSIAYTGGTAQTIRRTAGTTITIEDDDGLPSGTAGNVLTIGSITAAQHTWAKSGGGTVNVDYVTISNSNAEPANTFFAGENSVDGGGNTGWVFANAPAVTASGGGDSTRLRRRGRRPKYFWQQAIEDEKKDEIAEAASDAVADAYIIESHKEFAEQVSYIRNVEQRLRQAKFDEVAEQLRTALKDLEYRAEMRLLLANAQEEAEIRELMEII